MLTDCVIEDPRWARSDLAGLAELAAAAVLDRLGLEPSVFEIAVLGGDDRRIAELNTGFRGRTGATNVLSWPSAERGSAVAGEMPPAPGPGALGDIALAFETCRREAEAAGKPLADHTLHLVVHGTLHLLGFDHEREADARLMEGLEVEILGNLGLADPYTQQVSGDVPERTDGR